MSRIETDSDRRVTGSMRPPRWACGILTAWMLGVMVLSYILFNGPLVSSIVKRIPALRDARDGLVWFFGGNECE